MIKGFSISAPRISLEAVQREVESLSEPEKQRVVDDLYGSRCAQEQQPEEPRQEAQALHDLQEALDAIPECEKINLILAEQRCPDYVHSRSHQLMFLHCDNFNAQNAAARMAAYWNTKVQVFGHDRAFRRLSLDDLEQDDLHALHRGGIQILPTRDDAGRAILVSDRSRYEHRPTLRTSMVRVLWYMLHAALEDESVQRNGIIYVDGHPTTEELEHYDRKLDAIFLRQMREALPVRVVGVHIHSTNRFYREQALPVLLYASGSQYACQMQSALWEYQSNGQVALRIWYFVRDNADGVGWQTALAVSNVVGRATQVWIVK